MSNVGGVKSHTTLFKFVDFGFWSVILWLLEHSVLFSVGECGRLEVCRGVAL